MSGRTQDMKDVLVFESLIGKKQQLLLATQLVKMVLVRSIVRLFEQSEPRLTRRPARRVENRRRHHRNIHLKAQGAASLDGGDGWMDRRHPTRYRRVVPSLPTCLACLRTPRSKRSLSSRLTQGLEPRRSTCTSLVPFLKQRSLVRSLNTSYLLLLLRKQSTTGPSSGSAPSGSGSCSSVYGSLRLLRLALPSPVASPSPARLV
jgi:hypothetical protein